MKIFFTIVVFIFISSCSSHSPAEESVSNNKIKQENQKEIVVPKDTSITQQKENFRYEKIDYYLENVKKIEDLLVLYENKELMKEISKYEGKNQYENERWFLDGLGTCNNIIKFDLNTEEGKNEFMDYVGLKELYNYVLQNNYLLEDYLDKNGKILKEYQKGGRDDKEDILLAMFLAGKIDKNFILKEIDILSKNYKQAELSNSIILKILFDKISGKTLDENSCNQEFLDGYKKQNIAIGNIQ